LTDLVETGLLLFHDLLRLCFLKYPMGRRTGRNPSLPLEHFFLEHPPQSDSTPSGQAFAQLLIEKGKDALFGSRPSENPSIRNGLAHRPEHLLDEDGLKIGAGLPELFLIHLGPFLSFR
jgi:hypothetical protein